MHTGDSTVTKSKNLWLTSRSNMSAQARACFKELKCAEIKTVPAWALKEALPEMWGHSMLACAEKVWKRWYLWATHNRLEPMTAAAKPITRDLPNVLTYFAHRVTSAVAEALNTKISIIEKRACGYHKPNNFKVLVYRCLPVNTVY